jgi:hypothetical protein
VLAVFKKNKSAMCAIPHSLFVHTGGSDVGCTAGTMLNMCQASGVYSASDVGHIGTRNTEQIISIRQISGLDKFGTLFGCF